MNCPQKRNSTCGDDELWVDLFKIRPSISWGNENGYRGYNAITNAWTRTRCIRSTITYSSQVEYYATERYEKKSTVAALGRTETFHLIFAIRSSQNFYNLKQFRIVV